MLNVLCGGIGIGLVLGVVYGWWFRGYLERAIDQGARLGVEKAFEKARQGVGA